MAYPTHRPRRLRSTPALRKMVAETTLQPQDMIAPLFVKEGISDAIEIKSMPGVFQNTLESLRKEVNDTMNAGVNSVILFGVPAQKDEIGKPKRILLPNGVE